MRTINVNTITENIKDMCIQANHFLADDMDKAMKHALETEEAPLGRQILDQLQDNLKIAAEDMIPICQDTGMAVIFMKIGQDVHFEGGSLEDAINEGVRQGYVEGFLRKSVVGDPIIRENTKDNTPAVIHYSIVPRDKGCAKRIRQREYEPRIHVKTSRRDRRSKRSDPYSSQRSRTECLSADGSRSRNRRNI
mgnify:CR=1 FL=1